MFVNCVLNRLGANVTQTTLLSLLPLHKMGWKNSSGKPLAPHLETAARSIHVP